MLISSLLANALLSPFAVDFLNFELFSGGKVQAIVHLWILNSQGRTIDLLLTHFCETATVAKFADFVTLFVAFGVLKIRLSQFYRIIRLVPLLLQRIYLLLNLFSLLLKMI